MNFLYTADTLRVIKILEDRFRQILGQQPGGIIIDQLLYSMLLIVSLPSDNCIN